jgi:hypothetical protein
MNAISDTYEKNYAKKVNIDKNFEDQKLGLLQFMKENGFMEIFDLYQKDITNNTWKKQTLNSNGTVVVPINCN